MYRAGRGALDEQIAQVIAAVDHRRQLAEVEAKLEGETNKLRHMLGAIEMAIVMREHADDKTSLARLWSALRGARRTERIESLLEQADRAILAAAIEQELILLRDQRLELRRQMDKLADADEHLEHLLVEKEKWLASTDAPDAARAMVLAERLGHCRALQSVLAGAIETAQEVQAELHKARMFFESPIIAETGNTRAGMRAQAGAHMGIADGHLRRLGFELSEVAGACAVLGMEIPWFVADGERPPLVEIDNVYSEASWIWSVISEATKFRAACAAEIESLLAERKRLLASP